MESVFFIGGFMARPKKIGLDYFPMDCTWDEKMQGLELIHQNNGIVWIVKFWQRAYQTETGEVDFSGLFGVIQANNCRITTEEHQKIIDTCLQLGLLYKTDTGLYTSNGIKKRIGSVSKERQEAIQRQEDSKSKGKESIVKETPHYSANNSRTIPNNSKTEPDSDVIIPPEDIIPEEKSPTWKDSFEVYQDLVVEEFNEMDGDEEFIKKYEGRYSGINVRKSLEVINEFLNSEESWEYSKKNRKKSETLNFKKQVAFFITKSHNRVYKPRSF